MVAGELAEMAGGESGSNGNGGDGHRGRIELVATVLLAMAAVLTAWRMVTWLQRPLRPNPNHSEDSADSFAA